MLSVQVAAGDVEGICRARLKADAAAALDPSDRQAAAAAVRGLQRAAEEAEASGYGLLMPRVCTRERGALVAHALRVMALARSHDSHGSQLLPGHLLLVERPDSYQLCVAGWATRQCWILWQT